MVNIKQLTNYDIISTSIETKVIMKAGSLISYDYYVIPASLLTSNQINKLGYCCEVKGIAYPIFLTLNGTETEFQIGKTGMFEFQDETWKDVNKENIERTSTVYCSEVKVPINIKFTLDYCYTI